MSVDPASIGHATEFRLFEPLASLAGKPAPEGYEWVMLPGGGDMFGFGPRALMCCECGALVAMHEVHDAWHDAHTAGK